MNIYDKITGAEVTDSQIADEINGYKELALYLEVDINHVIQMRNALEIEQLREVMVKACVFQHNYSHLQDVVDRLNELCGK